MALENDENDEHRISGLDHRGGLRHPALDSIDGSEDHLAAKLESRWSSSAKGAARFVR
jgi:hypothetical protein